MLVAGIKSRPAYGMLTADPHARRHWIVAEGEGAMAVIDLATKVAGDFLPHATIFYVPGGANASTHTERLRALGADVCHVSPTVATCLTRLNGALAGAVMGTRLYVAGTEGFIGTVIQLTVTHGIDHRSVICEHRGSLARRVYCIHCKGSTENVTTNIVPCSHCGLSLLVRDHYSRRLGGFMGVCADAEAPGELPPVREAFT